MQHDNLLPLLYSTAKGDRHAFATLYQQTSGKLLAISLNMLTNRAHAEEVLQETFIKIWYNASEYNSSKGSVISWMVSIVRYRSLDTLRYYQVRKEQSIVDDDINTHDVEVNYNVNTKLISCLEQLEPQQKQAIHLAYYKGLSHSELVAHIDTPLGTVKSWIRRGLVQLQRCLTV